MTSCGLPAAGALPCLGPDRELEGVGRAVVHPDLLVEVAPDPELGREGFTYRLESGAEGTVHLDHVLRFVRDPEYQRDELLYELTIEARDALASSGRTKRSVARQLGTSLAQLARLLDPTNDRKSIDQMVRLLAALGRRVDLRFTTLQPARRRRAL
jgi:hypothetical protein